MSADETTAPTPEEAEALVAKAHSELDATKRIVEVLAPLAPENRRRILSAVCELHGLPNPYTRGMKGGVE